MENSECHSASWTWRTGEVGRTAGQSGSVPDEDQPLVATEHRSLQGRTTISPEDRSGSRHAAVPACMGSFVESIRCANLPLPDAGQEPRSTVRVLLILRTERVVQRILLDPNAAKHRRQSSDEDQSEAGPRAERQPHPEERDRRARVHRVAHESVRATGDDVMVALDGHERLMERPESPMTPLPDHDAEEENGDSEEEHCFRGTPCAPTREADSKRSGDESSGQHVEVEQRPTVVADRSGLWSAETLGELLASEDRHAGNEDDEPDHRRDVGHERRVGACLARRSTEIGTRPRRCRGALGDQTQERAIEVPVGRDRGRQRFGGGWQGTRNGDIWGQPASGALLSAAMVASSVGLNRPDARSTFWSSGDFAAT